MRTLYPFNKDRYIEYLLIRQSTNILYRQSFSYRLGIRKRSYSHRMSARSAYRPSQACSSVRTPAVARKADHSPADSLHPASPVASSTPRRRSGRRRAAAQPSMMSPLERFLALQAPREPQMGANVFSRPWTQHDPIRMFSQAGGSPFDSVRRCQTPRSSRNLPDTEEVTGSNPVRPTPFFEILSSDESPDESQRPGVLSLRCWSQHPRLRPA